VLAEDVTDAVSRLKQQNDPWQNRRHGEKKRDPIRQG
jgi:hypothetical protein